MKTFIEAIIGLVIATLGIGGVVVGVMAAMLKSPAGVIALAGATMLVVAMCGTLAVVVGIWLWDWVKRSTLEHAQAAEFIKPDEHGRLPLSVDAMRHPAFITQVLNTYPQSYMQNVTTYSPRNDHRGQLPEIAPPIVPPMVAPPSFAELYSTNQLPRNGYLLG